MPEASRDLVLKKIRDCFPDPQLETQALAIVDQYGAKSWHRERERVQLAIIMLSGGDIERLQRAVNTADKDFRDVLVGAEYPEQFNASSKTPPEAMAAIRQQDRARYEAWLKSGAA